MGGEFSASKIEKKKLGSFGAAGAHGLMMSNFFFINPK